MGWGYRDIMTWRNFPRDRRGEKVAGQDVFVVDRCKEVRSELDFLVLAEGRGFKSRRGEVERCHVQTSNTTSRLQRHPDANQMGRQSRMINSKKLGQGKIALLLTRSSSYHVVISLTVVTGFVPRAIVHAQRIRCEPSKRPAAPSSMP